MNNVICNIVLPVHNKFSTIRRAIESLQAQTVTNFTCAVVADACTDNSVEVIQAAIEGDERFTFHAVDFHNVAQVRNYGLAQGTAPFCLALDGDDWLEPQFLAACVPALQQDRSLGIAYTGLTYHKPDGSTGLSPWPGQFDADKHMAGQNQIPTACVFRREAFERAGGYRARYCDPELGAGAEDYFAWLSIVSLGYGAQKVTDAGLFHYAWQSGLVSGNKDYHQPDVTVLLPWTKDGQHPFASPVTPANKLAHPVRSYNRPAISVIIPVGPGHESLVRDALDSLEGQSLRQWEAIVVWDNPTDPEAAFGHAYPFVTLIRPDQASIGSGAARNRGAESAVAPLLLFLDADDTLAPDCLQRLLNAYIVAPAIVYSDYVGKAYIDDQLAVKLQNEGRLLERHTDTWALIAYKAFEYDCPRAQRQPDPQDVYIWNLITSLVPKAWHDAIGGFDETMPSWEDWDYWIRLARAGHCFTRIPEQLVGYRFYTGGRRETGRVKHESLIQYMHSKYEGMELMACRTCGSNAQPTLPPAGNAKITAQAAAMHDSDFILCLYDYPKRGDHHVVGGNIFPARFSNVGMFRQGQGFKIDYGYRSTGDRFYVHKDDIAAQPHLFKPIQIPTPTATVQAAPPPLPPPRIIPPRPTLTPPSVAPTAAAHEPERPSRAKAVVAERELGPAPLPAEMPFAMELVPGVSPDMARLFNEQGIHTLQDLIDAGVGKLMKIKGVGPVRAKLIVTYATEQTQPK